MEPEVRAETERWFVRRGIPHFIEDYSAGTDIFTRAAPFLALVLFAELFLTFGDRFSGLAQGAVFLAGLGALIAVGVLVNRLRGRRPLQLPDDIGAPELAIFVLVPPLLRLIADPDPLALIGLVVLQLVILGLVYVVTSFGLLPMMTWSIIHFLRSLTQLGSLLVRVLPLMLVFSLFLFVNAEVWQVANDMLGAYFAAIMVVFALLCAAFVAWSAAGEAGEIEQISTWEDARRRAATSPLAGVETLRGSPQEIPPLSSAARANIQLLLVVSRLAPVLLVTAGVFLLYTGFGLLTIREETILQWITDDALASGDVLWRGALGGGEVLLTTQLLYVAGLIAAISGLQFAVSLATEPAARENFAGDVVREVREAVATRALYLASSTNTPSGDDNGGSSG